MYFINRIKLPDGTVYRRGDPFPKFESKDQDVGYIIGNITVAPKQSEDVGDETATDMQERDSSVELWADAPVEMREQFTKNGMTICHRVYPSGVLAEEMWELSAAMEVIRERLELDILDDEEPAQANGGTQQAQAQP